jgi:hypothetical protein
MPPSKKPIASVKPGIMLIEKFAMVMDVKNTSANPSKKIERFHFQKLFHEVCHAASNSSGGRKIRNTISGLTLILGICGMNEIHKPPITRKIG